MSIPALILVIFVIALVGYYMILMLIWILMNF